jgi:hypothetical protein
MFDPVRGQSLSEYAVTLAIVSVLVLAIALMAGWGLADTLTTVGNGIASVVNGFQETKPNSGDGSGGSAGSGGAEPDTDQTRDGGNGGRIQIAPTPTPTPSPTD